jgi:hypothetical protein
MSGQPAFDGAERQVPSTAVLEATILQERECRVGLPDASLLRDLVPFGGIYFMDRFMFGIPPDQAFALSLIKRAADLAVGLPGLVALQVLEGKRLSAIIRAT